MTEPDAAINSKGPAFVTRPPIQDRPPLTLTYVDGIPLLTVVEAQQVPLHVEIVDAATNTSRFFAIDKNWTDPLIDGALSLANHQLPEFGPQA